MTVISSPPYRWRVGEVEITRVLEFEAALFEPAVLYPEVSVEVVRQHRGWLEPTLMDPASGLLVFAFHSTVVRTPRATILVDTCSGNDKERPHKLRYHRKNWPYLANLALAGFAPEDIDYVLCTHLHADHVGWNTRLLNGRWVPITTCDFDIAVIGQLPPPDLAFDDQFEPRPMKVVGFHTPFRRRRSSSESRSGNTEGSFGYRVESSSIYSRRQAARGSNSPGIITWRPFIFAVSHALPEAVVNPADLVLSLNGT
jgi:hypothetical protein